MRAEKILVIENERIIAKDLELSLEHLGWNVCETAYSGKEALEKVHIMKPDLILMDIKLGNGTDGIEVAQKITSIYDVPVIYLTAFADSEILNRGKVTNPCGYIIKPVEERNLRISIEMGLYNHRMRKQLYKQEKWLDLIVKKLDEGLIVINRKGIIQLMNSAAESKIGRGKKAADSGLIALKEFHRNPRQFGMVILDSVMPNLSGPQLAEKILEIRPYMPVFMCNGFRDSETVEMAMIVGTKEVVMKPIITAQLPLLIRSLLDEGELSR